MGPLLCKKYSYVLFYVQLLTGSAYLCVSLLMLDVCVNNQVAEMLSELEQSVAEGSPARQELHGTKEGKRKGKRARGQAKKSRETK